MEPNPNRSLQHRGVPLVNDWGHPNHESAQSPFDDSASMAGSSVSQMRRSVVGNARLSESLALKMENARLRDENEHLRCMPINDVVTSQSTVELKQMEIQCKSLLTEIGAANSKFQEAQMKGDFIQGRYDQLKLEHNALLATHESTAAENAKWKEYVDEGTVKYNTMENDRRLLIQAIVPCNAVQIPSGLSEDANRVLFDEREKYRSTLIGQVRNRMSDEINARQYLKAKRRKIMKQESTSRENTPGTSSDAREPSSLSMTESPPSNEMHVKAEPTGGEQQTEGEQMDNGGEQVEGNDGDVQENVEQDDAMGGNAPPVAKSPSPERGEQVDDKVDVDSDEFSEDWHDTTGTLVVMADGGAFYDDPESTGGEEIKFETGVQTRRKCKSVGLTKTE